MIEKINNFRGIVGKVVEGTNLTVEEAREAFNIMMSGDATPAQMGAFLVAMRIKGETVEEITGAVMTMREKMRKIDAPIESIDIVGTGGDGKGTVNISTATSFVVAACGIPVAKHGNRAASSKTGAADVLSSLGVNLDADFSLVKKSLWEIGICFMMAQRHHGAMRNVGPTRAELGTRTIFNILGPMSNPANVNRQLIGVFSRDWLLPMAQTLRNLGTEKIWVVHGSDGTDELTTTGLSYVVEIENQSIREFEIHPSQANISVASLKDLRGGLPKENAKALLEVLDGKRGAFRDIVTFNTAAALLIADKVTDLQDGVTLAENALDSGAAKEKLTKLISITNTNL